MRKSVLRLCSAIPKQSVCCRALHVRSACVALFPLTLTSSHGRATNQARTPALCVVPARYNSKGPVKGSPWSALSKNKSAFIKDTDILYEYGLTETDLEGLAYKTLRNAYELEQHVFPQGRYESRLYPRDQVVQRALKKYRSQVNLQKNKHKFGKVKKEEEEDMGDAVHSLLKILTKEKKEPKTNPSWAASQEHRRDQITSSLKVVSFSIATNLVVAVAKFASYFATGSASMLSEAVHSIIDTMNQMFLAFGLVYSLKKPHSDHPYGFDKARYVYALISGVSIFQIGAVFAIKHGVTQLYHPTLVLDYSMISTAFAVLFFTLVFEGWSLSFAYQQVRIQSKREGVSVSHYILKGYEPNTIAVLAEDIAATVGVLIAGAGIGLSAYTGNPIYDALGSIGVGTLLGGMAVFIIVRNKDALIGRAMDSGKQQAIVRLLERQESVLCVNDVKSMVEGPSYVRFKAEIFFNTDVLTQKYMSTLDKKCLLTEAQSLTSEHALDTWMRTQNQLLVDTLAIEVDRLEGLIKRGYPEIRHVDLEVL